jgi:flagellin
MVINTNTTAQAAANSLAANSAHLAKSLARLSSGSKIVDPADDAAGLALSSRLDAHIQRTNAAQANVGNALSFTQTQDGYLKKVAKALDRMSELAILAQDVTKTDSDRSLYQAEFGQLASYITSAASKDFNGVSLFSTNALGVTTDAEGGTFTMAGINLASATFSSALSASVGTTVGAAAALASVKAATSALAADRANIGAYQARLNAIAEQLTFSKENLSAATSRLRDVDVSDEATEYARYNILVQSGTAMLAQANQMPQTVLRLLQ